MPTELTLAELADASGLQPRTIRSWVAQGLLSGPLSRGPGARYPADQLERLLAIRTMKDLLGMSLTDIRRELLVASADQIRLWAEKAEGIAPESPLAASIPESPDPGAALDYFRSLRARDSPSRSAPSGEDMVLSAPAADLAPASGLEALERRLQPTSRRANPDRRARGEEWIRFSVTPDVELSVRGPLDPEQRARLERCADLMRYILTGRET